MKRPRRESAASTIRPSDRLLWPGIAIFAVALLIRLIHVSLACVLPAFAGARLFSKPVGLMAGLTLALYATELAEHATAGV